MVHLFLFQDYLTDEIRSIMRQRPGTRTEEQIIEVNEPIILIYLYRGSYMSAHVLLNLLNELGKR